METRINRRGPAGGPRPTAPITVPNREQHRLLLDETNILAGPSRDFAEKVFAKIRHEARVKFAMDAARDAAMDAARLAGVHPSPAMWAIFAAEEIGIGGRANMEGRATPRHPAFAECGTGRKQAGDGGAWTAAINQAQKQLGADYVANSKYVRFAATEGRIVARLFWHTDTADASTVDWEDFDVEAVLPASWRDAVVKHGIANAAYQSQGTNTSLLGLDLFDTVSSLADWMGAFERPFIATEPKEVSGMITPEILAELGFCESGVTEFKYKFGIAEDVHEISFADFVEVVGKVDDKLYYQGFLEKLTNRLGQSWPESW